MVGHCLAQPSSVSFNINCWVVLPTITIQITAAVQASGRQPQALHVNIGNGHLPSETRVPRKKD